MKKSPKIWTTNNSCEQPTRNSNFILPSPCRWDGMTGQLTEKWRRQGCQQQMGGLQKRDLLAFNHVYWSTTERKIYTMDICEKRKVIVGKYEGFFTYFVLIVNSYGKQLRINVTLDRTQNLSDQCWIYIGTLQSFLYKPDGQRWASSVPFS